MKTAKLFWSVGSILVNVTIGIYIYLQNNGPQGLQERFQYVNEQWTIYNGHWKVEFLIMTLIGAAAIYFAIYYKNISWSIVTIGQLIILLTYPLMLGGYRNTPFDIAEMANQVATNTFIFGNLIFFLGLLMLYLKNDLFKPWLHYTAIAISGSAMLLFLLIFMEFLAWKDALIFAPLVNLLYFINAYYGWKLKPIS